MFLRPVPHLILKFSAKGSLDTLGLTPFGGPLADWKFPRHDADGGERGFLSYVASFPAFNGRWQKISLRVGSESCSDQF